MSLIDDALKRAQEAGGAEARPADRPWIPTPMPDPGFARGLRLRRMAGAALLAAAAGGAVYLWLGRTSTSETPAAAVVPAFPTAAAASAGSAPTELPLVIVSTPVRPRTAAAVSRAPREVAAPPAAPAAAEASESPAEREPTPRPLPRLGAARTYAGGVTFPSGERIELGGIVWSETAPRALLNDRIVGVGGYVEGYEVTRIDTDRVELQKDGVTITVTVK